MTWWDTFVHFAHSQVHERVVDSLNARGVSDGQIKEFQIGYVNKRLPPECPAEFVQWCHGGSKLEDMYVFPLTNILNEIHGLQFRHVRQDKPGYMDFVNLKGEAVLFGLGAAAPHIWKRCSITLVEGNFDHFPVQRHDPTVVATLTARPPENLIWWLRRVCDRVVLAYDADKTGRKGVLNFQKYYKNQFREIVDVQPPILPTGNAKSTKDLGDLWELWGDTKFGEFYRQKTRNTQLEW